jgi:CBS-domain-containing membrane protein
MNVADIMTREPITVTPETPVQEVARLLVHHDISGVPVLAPDRRLLGMVTEEDLIVRHANLHLPIYVMFVVVRGEHEFEEETRRALAATAGELMSDQPHTIAPDADIADAATLMMDTHANPIPVVTNGVLVGIISRADIVRLMVLKDEQAESAAP